MACIKVKAVRQPDLVLIILPSPNLLSRCHIDNNPNHLAYHN